MLRPGLLAILISPLSGELVPASKDPRGHFAALSGSSSLAVEMPLDQHWQRVNTPLRQLTRRERRVLVVGTIAVLAALLALILVTSGSSSRPLPPGCIDALVPGPTGAMPVSACGARARGICAAHARLQDPGSRAIRASCRRAGLL